MSLVFSIIFVLNATFWFRRRNSTFLSTMLSWRPYKGKQSEFQLQFLCKLSFTIVQYQLFCSGDTEVRQSELSAYVEHLQTEISESVSLLQRQFQLVRSFEPTELEQSAGLKPANVAKNRKGAPLPTDSSRVLLMPKPGEDGSDYINASFLPGLCKVLATRHGYFK